MSIVYNNTTIENITYNGNNIDIVNYNNTEVFSGVKYTLRVSWSVDNIKNVIVNGISYSNSYHYITLSFKPGTSITLGCTLADPHYYSSTSVTYKPIFKYWNGYTYETNQTFTFTMPNEDIRYNTYTDSEGISINWPSSGNLSEHQLLVGVKSANFDTSLVGRIVALKEGTSKHNWRIVRVNDGSKYYSKSPSFDLWYEGSIGTACWSKQYYMDWDAEDSTTPNTGYNGKNNPRYVCTQYKSKLSSDIRKVLKTDLYEYSTEDTVIILSSGQLGKSVPNAGGIPYFRDNVSNRSLGFKYWCNGRYNVNFNYAINADGNFASYTWTSELDIVPAIRVG